MSTKMSSRFWVSMLVFGMMGQVAWVVENMYFNVFIYKMFNATAGDISLMVMASAVMAALTTIAMGVVSDRVGRRKAFITWGYIIWGVSIVAFAYIKSVALTIVMDCVMTFFGSTANDAAYNAWLTDMGDSSNRGRIEGLNSMMPLVAILIVFGGFMGFDLDARSSWVKIYYIIGTATVGIGVLGLFLIDESPKLSPSSEPFMASLLYSFKPSVMKQNQKLYRTLGMFALFGISIQVFMPYLIIYYEKTLGLSNYVMVLAPAIVLAAIATAFFGRLYDRKGFFICIGIALTFLCVGYGVLYVSSSILPVFLGSLCMMSGYLMGMSVFGAQIRDLIPEGRAGQFQGARIIGQVLIPGIIGPAIGAVILQDAPTIINADGTVSFLPNASLWIYALWIIFLLIVMLFLENCSWDRDCNYGGDDIEE